MLVDVGETNAISLQDSIIKAKKKKNVSTDTEAKATSYTSYYFHKTLEPLIGHSRDRDCTEH